MKLYTSVKSDIDPALFKERAKLAAHAVAQQAERDMRAYIPAQRVSNSAAVDGRRVSWSHPLAPVMFHGYVYVDPVYNVGGFPTKDGFRSRPGVAKVRSNRMFHFKTGGPRWTDRAAEQCVGGWVMIARRILQNGK